MEEHNMSLTELAEKSGVPMETLRNIYYAKVTDPKASTLMSIAKVFNVSVNHLMGESFCSKDEVQLLQYYRKCGSHGKSIIRLVSKHEAKTAKRERESFDKHEIPCLVATKRSDDGFTYDDSEVVYTYTNNKEAFAGIKITSNAYAPIYCKGDIVLLADRFPDNGEKAVFVENGIGHIRKYIEHEKGYTLKSINRQGHDIDIKRMDNIDCYGTCIGVIME